jgi:hypothetical protein
MKESTPPNGIRWRVVMGQSAFFGGAFVAIAYSFSTLFAQALR